MKKTWVNDAELKRVLLKPKENIFFTPMLIFQRQFMKQRNFFPSYIADLMLSMRQEIFLTHQKKLPSHLFGSFVAIYFVILQKLLFFRILLTANAGLKCFAVKQQKKFFQ